ncbi:MAG: hypothetical protein ACRDZY_17815, partial [Acidimicrobiales bacterium]
VESGRPTEAAFENLEAATRRVEALQLSLRTRRGVPAAALSGRTQGASVSAAAAASSPRPASGGLQPDGAGIDPLLDGLVLPVGDRLVLTPRGRLLANEVALRLSA